MARNAAAAAAAAAVLLLLAVSVYAAAAGATVGPPTAVLQETDAAGVEETSSLLPVHRDGDKEEDIKTGKRWGATGGDAASLASAADEEGKEAGSDWGKPKKLDDGDKIDSDSDSESDSGSDSDSDSESDSDSDSDSDDEEEDHNSMQGSKKHPGPGRKGAQPDDELPEMVIKV